MTDNDLLVVHQLLKKMSKKDLIFLCLMHLIKIEKLRQEVHRLKTNNKVGKNRGNDEDNAFLLFLNYFVEKEKRPTLEEWNSIVGSTEIKWKYDSLKVKDKLDLLENGLTRTRAKGWYYRFTKDIELFLKQKLVN